jgi:hypothetical protein
MTSFRSNTRARVSKGYRQLDPGNLIAPSGNLAVTFCEGEKSGNPGLSGTKVTKLPGFESVGLLRVEKQPTGLYAILAGDALIRGDLATNADAWSALDRLTGDDVSPSESRASWAFMRAAIAAPYALPVARVGKPKPKRWRKRTPRFLTANIGGRHA